jgi:hypothetical protein
MVGSLMPAEEEGNLRGSVDIGSNWGRWTLEIGTGW